jgi:hypothetical protein
MEATGNTSDTHTPSCVTTLSARDATEHHVDAFEHGVLLMGGFLPFLGLAEPGPSSSSIVTSSAKRIAISAESLRSSRSAADTIDWITPI